MTWSLRSLAALALLASPLAAAPPPETRLYVIVSVDGLSWQRLASYRPWYRAGLARLLSEGRVETAARYAHLNTETGPGHAALGTGAPPRVTGIVTNRWYEARPDGTLKDFYCTDEEAPGAPSGKPIPGPASLKVPTFGDRLVDARPGARVVSLSGKDRGAIFLAGHRPEDAVFWYDPSCGRFTSSAAYDTARGHARRVSELVDRFNAGAGGKLVARFGRFWSPLPPPHGAAALPQPEGGLALYQLPLLGLGFDHAYEKDEDGYFSGLWHSPAIDEMVTDLAVSALDDEALALGRGAAPDLLCLSYSAQDLVAHSYGNESEEDLDVLRRLDLQVGRLLDALDAKVGKGRVLLALSADHGFSPIPEVRKRRGEHAGRLVTSRRSVFAYVPRLNRRLDELLCLDPKARPIAGADGFDLYYQPKPMTRVAGSCGPAGAEVGKDAIDAALPGAVHELFAEEVEEVLLASRRGSWPDDAAARFAANDFFPSRSGDALLIPKPGVLVHWDPARGSGHGSHYEESIHVPLVFWGGGVRAGNADAPAAPYDLAPTLAARAGVALPDATGKALPLE